MKTLLNGLAASVILGGAAVLGSPAPVSATYLNPLSGGGGSAGVSFCCATGTTHCCYTTGCATKEGVCVRVMPSS